jgi:hypothetical protein
MNIAVKKFVNFWASKVTVGLLKNVYIASLAVVVVLMLIQLVLVG